MSAKFNVGGAYRAMDTCKANIGGVWKSVTNISTNIGGVWKNIYGAFVRYGKAYFDGNGDYLTIPASEDWNFGAGNFCIEMLLNFTAISSSTLMYLIGQHQSDSEYLYFRKNDDSWKMWRFAVESGGGWVINILFNSTLFPAAGIETHVALVRNGNTFKVYVGGVEAGTATSSASIPNFSGPLTLGATGIVAASMFSGKMGGVRITKGDARYTSAFTPPTAFAVDSANVKLCMRFAEPIGSTTFTDDTGKAVTTVGNVIIVE